MRVFTRPFEGSLPPSIVLGNKLAASLVQVPGTDKKRKDTATCLDERITHVAEDRWLWELGEDGLTVSICLFYHFCSTISPVREYQTIVPVTVILLYFTCLFSGPNLS